VRVSRRSGPLRGHLYSLVVPLLGQQSFMIFSIKFIQRLTAVCYIVNCRYVVSAIVAGPVTCVSSDHAND